MRPLISFILISLFNLYPLLTIAGDNDAIDEHVLSTWIDETRYELRSIDPSSEVTEAKFNSFERDGHIHQIYSIRESGIVRFESGEWVYIVVHSQHDNKAIGDIAIAVDHKGRMYYNLGHVCRGSVSYKASSEFKYSTSKDFFKNFKDTNYRKNWQRLKGNKIDKSSIRISH